MALAEHLPLLGGPTLRERRLTRREVLAGLGGAGAAAALIGPGAVRAVAGALRPGGGGRTASSVGSDPHHLGWVWQFRHDGEPAFVRDTLASYGLGVALKTHDGTDWMSRYDPTSNAVASAARVEAFAHFFENGGVPFHAWAVVTGSDPEREARMASDVLDAGARSLFLDLEPHKGFWAGSPEAAQRFGEALRRLQPSARVVTSVDARPWTIDRIPMSEFAAFSDAIAPQAYWSTFASPDNMVRYLASGEVVGPAGITPAFVIAAAVRRLASYGLPVHPIGDGTATASNGWREFVDASYGAAAESISVWRFGVADPAIWPLLRELAPRVLSYVVQPGDTLAAIAEKWDTSVDAIVAANELTNPNVIVAGTRLRMPYGAAPHVDATRSSEEAYIVESGDTLWSIAQRFGTSVEALMQANGLSDASVLLVGQRLVLP
ncbi:MAG: LysM peptidoglycan-binding domain-containing protein [Dehalococcoidia bacterium]|nr:LysM peptidoglycan-binding domain-containing protein [Dehalococcoidia bacterium]